MSLADSIQTKWDNYQGSEGVVEVELIRETVKKILERFDNGNFEISIEEACQIIKEEMGEKLTNGKKY